jgi:hypothetical protein
LNSPRYFHLHISKYSPQHPVLKHPHSIFFQQRERQRYTHKTKGKNTVLYQMQEKINYFEINSKKHFPTSVSSGCVRFKVFTALKMMFFWVLAPCRLIGRCRPFGETYCLHLQGWRWKTQTNIIPLNVFVKIILIWIVAFCVITRHSLLVIHQRFRGTSCLYV